MAIDADQRTHGSHAQVWTPETYAEDLRAQLRHVSWASVVCTTAIKGGCHRFACSLVWALLGRGRCSMLADWRAWST